MKRQDWFAYDNGYINIDDENLYFSRTGVWSEVRLLDEKSSDSNLNDNINRFRILLFMIPAMGLLAYVMYLSINSLMSGKDINWGLNALLQYIGAPILCVFGIIYIYKYFKKDLGPSFKIPLIKIESIEFEGVHSVCLTFLDSNEKQQKIQVKKVESKGIDILSNLDLQSESLQSK